MNKLFVFAEVLRSTTEVRLRRFVAETKTDLSRLHRWLRKAGPFYFGSAFAHLLIVGLLLSWTFNKAATETATSEPPIDTEIDVEIIEFQLGTAQVLATELSPETIAKFQQPLQSEKHFDEQAIFEEAGGGTASLSTQPIFGGLGGFEMNATDDGPRAIGDGGVGIGLGSSSLAGNGGAEAGLDGAGHGHREAIEGPLDYEKSDRAVAAALNWFYRHQHQDGHWSLTDFGGCTAEEAVCTGQGHIQADAAATALALLPFLAAGQTHAESGFYKPTVARGVEWLVTHQKENGDLSADADQTMYAHALATLALCEDYAKTTDKRIAAAAQRAVKFIEASQNSTTGGWQYQPGDFGDSSSTSWQVLALRSAELAGLTVEAGCLAKAEKWFHRCSQGEHGGLISYTPGTAATINMTALGLLARQSLGASRSEPFMIEGLSAIQAAVLPEESLSQDLFRTYFVTQALYNNDPLSARWDAWNLQVRRALLAKQDKSGCATGSWLPTESGEIWTVQGGRLLATSLATLTLTVSYRSSPHNLQQPWLLVREPKQLARRLQSPANGAANPHADDTTSPPERPQY